MTLLEVVYAFEPALEEIRGGCECGNKYQGVN